MAVVSARPQQLGPLYNDIESDYNDIEDETDPRFGFDVSKNITEGAPYGVFFVSLYLFLVLPIELFW